MYCCSLNPQNLSASELDTLLESGFFRSGQTMFTTSFLKFENDFYDAIWLRIKLSEFKASNEIIRIAKRAKRFKTVVRKAIIDAEKENLFQDYKSKIAFVSAQSLYQLLMDEKVTVNLFNSFEVCVYDQERLIACGYFDTGAKTGMGINCFYHPDYSSFSLGKYIIYQKILFCIDQGFDFFYPGYFAPNFNRFNYKLSIAQQGLYFYHLKNRSWNAFDEWSESLSTLLLMNSKLKALQETLAKAGVHSMVKYYRHFDASLFPNQTFKNFLEYPILLEFSDYSTETELCLGVYDIFEDEYVVLQSYAVFEVLELESSETEISRFVLDHDYVIFKSNNALEITSIMLD
jgi:arginine-tRNA-protein transferase